MSETYYCAAILTNLEAGPAPFPVEVQMPAACVGYFLVFETLEAALEWADGDVGAIRPIRVTRTEAGRP